MITVKEIARMCGVSAGTVSNVLNGRPNVGRETRERVLEAIKETGYQPNYFASSIRKQNTRMISIIAEDLCQFSTPPIVSAAMAYCEERGYRTVLMNLRMYDRWEDARFDREKLDATLHPVLKEVQSIKVDGVIYVAGHCRTIGSFPGEFGLPSIIAYATSEGGRFPSVIPDDEKGGRDMIRYLISMGHEKIGIVAGTAGNVHTESRLCGCRRAFEEAGLPWNPEQVAWGDWQRQSGHDCGAKLIEDGATAVWCMNDAMAGGVYDYAREKGLKVGQDISVAGYDNTEISGYLHPGLTTNELPLWGIGRAAAERLTDMLEGGLPPDREPLRLPCKMVLRGSVGRREG